MNILPRFLLSLSIAIPALLAAAIPAHAANQRSFVKSNGSDSNPCNLLSPCRSFDVAITATNAGGEVVILDTAGYGPMTIGKSIKIIGPSGVYGGISVLGVAATTTGVTINAGGADVITLRGLDIAGVPTTPALPLYGIDIQSAGTVHIEKSTISNFTQDTSACINMDTANPVQVYVSDSFLRECRHGIFVNGTGVSDAARPSLVIDNTRIEHGLNTVLTGTTAIRLDGAFVLNLRNSVIAGAGDGIRAFNNIATVGSRMYVSHSQITRTGNAAIEMLGGNSAPLLVNVSESVLDLNAAGLLLGHGSARFINNVISNNTNSLVNCGGVSANVLSLGYGGGIGSNWIEDNSDSALPGGCSAYITPGFATAK